MKTQLRLLLNSFSAFLNSKSGNIVPTFLRNLKWPKALKFILPRALELKIEITFTLIILVVLSAFNFYGMHTDRFYFGIPENYVFTGLALLNIWYVRHLWRRLNDHGVSNKRIRKMELIMYAVWFGYGYLMVDVIIGLQETRDLKNYIVADSFFVRSYCMIVLYGLLMLLSLRTFLHRKALFGSFSFKNSTEDLDNWSPADMSE
ncbi:MAG: hypothetical protein OEQ81_04780 [Flavobacteriaceae bacterium]|nr:hypothetical protein [Flavobacteriaceae bacterium]